MMFSYFPRFLLSGDVLGPIALTYHSIWLGRGTPKWKWSVSISRFKRQLQILKDNGWNTACISEMLAWHKLPNKTVFITFDDGYADNLYAFDALSNLGMKATWFIVTDHIGGRSTWEDQESNALPMLRDEDLTQMHAAGMEIGSHGHTHTPLTDLPSDKLHSELTRSKDVLEGILSCPVISFAYPYGHCSQETADAVAAAGYQLACTTMSGKLNSNESLYMTRRLSIYNTDGQLDFAIKIALSDNEAGITKLGKYYFNALLHKARQ